MSCLTSSTFSKLFVSYFYGSLTFWRSWRAILTICRYRQAEPESIDLHSLTVSSAQVIKIMATHNPPPLLSNHKANASTTKSTADLDDWLTDTRARLLDHAGFVDVARDEACVDYHDVPSQMTGGRLVARFLVKSRWLGWLYYPQMGDDKVDLDRGWVHYEHVTLGRIYADANNEKMPPSSSSSSTSSSLFAHHPASAHVRHACIHSVGRPPMYSRPLACRSDSTFRRSSCWRPFWRWRPSSIYRWVTTFPSRPIPNMRPRQTWTPPSKPRRFVQIPPGWPVPMVRSGNIYPNSWTA